MSTFAQAGSGWTLAENHSMILEMVDYEPMGGTRHFIVLEERGAVSLRLGKNLNRLLSTTKSHRSQTYFCERVFQGFTHPDLLKKHQEMCRHFPIQVTKTVDQEISFKNWAKTKETLL